MSVTRFKSKNEMIVAEDGGYVLYEHYAAQTLTWREAKPTEAGWWWRRDKGFDDVIVKIEYRDGGLRYLNGMGWLLLEHHTGGEWAGPLPTPREAK